ncbi:formyltetrahydrofolate deformylase [Natronocella acetinitrilica]|uniref:Formyltetrahydrofolate deformylase n=1 Tax=Natronocella acetinitrilica TaxID=414046 RepID=A0AAE3G567_9GAMM|nr:formyltetrahydrofolate deformylase [Natronocella acetinitrilica]MCP1675254.1 formyltetrahydrofolate deformylase [Natronocella acetinitrilica]
MDANAPILILKLTCADRPGIVAAVSGLIAEHGGNILESSQFDDLRTGQFFMRVRFSFAEAERFSFFFKPVAERFSMRWDVQREDVRGRVLIMVSRFDHCLVDLLYRWRTGTIPMDVVAIVSNHETARPIAELHDLPFHHLPVTRETRAAQEAKLLGLVEETGADLVVLARYMQILSDGLSNRLFGKVINIHHSFLPGFKGARPYHQAHERGVKLIGATAHYVTADLDEGPIIEQDVERVDHADEPEDLIEIGQTLECQALARAVRWHLEHRVLLNGSKTVVFR